MTRYAPSASRPQFISMHLCHPSTLTTSCRLSSDNYQPSAFPVRKPVLEPSTWMPVWRSARDRAPAGEAQGRLLLGRIAPRFKTQSYTKCRDCTNIYGKYFIPRATSPMPSYAVIPFRNQCFAFSHIWQSYVLVSFKMPFSVLGSTLPYLGAHGMWLHEAGPHTSPCFEPVPRTPPLPLRAGCGHQGAGFDLLGPTPAGGPAWQRFGEALGV